MGTRENRTGIFELGQNPELADLFRVALRNLALTLRTHSVATVKAYNPATQKVTVSVDMLQVVKDNLTEPSAANPNPTSVQDPILLTNIPVAWPRTGQGFLHFPLNPGDTGELHVQDRTLSQWLALGKATDPRTSFAHSLADSVFHPTIAPDSNPLTPPALFSTHAVLEGPLIALGALAASPVLKGTEAVAAINAYATAVNAANAALNALAVAWAGVPGPAQVAFAGGFAAWNTAITTASITLATSLANALSTKTFTE